MKNDNQINMKVDASMNQESMLDYLQGDNSNLKNHDFEQSLLNDSFIGDALDGLYGKLDNNELKGVQSNLNSFIKKRLSKEKYKVKKNISFPIWITLIAIILLLISIAGYVIVSLLEK